MYGGPTSPVVVAGLPATGLAFGLSTTIGLVVAALTLIFAGLAMVRIAPARHRP
jgi:uncharacterized membrane protein